jgi:hypothetical protein
MPIPAPPRTPTPPPDEEIEDAAGFEMEEGLQTPPSRLSPNPRALSPHSANLPPPQFALMQGSPRRTLLSPTSSTFPNSPYSSTGGYSEIETPATGTSDGITSPFNFVPQTYIAGKPTKTGVS